MSQAPHPLPSVLIVEDDEHVMQLLKFILERQGYRVTPASDGRTARELIENGKKIFDLALFDVMLPYADGFELVRVARAARLGGSAHCHADR